MATQRVILHVGTPKSGTTYLQNLMWDHRDALTAAGVLYPGDRPDAHFLAVQDLKDREYLGWQDPAVVGAWSLLVEAARAHAGTTVISHELFGDLSAEPAAAALSDLDFAEVHLVVTARDLARQLPAVWQEDLKHRHHLPLADLVELVRPGTDRPDVLRPAGLDPEGHAAAFWLRQDVAAVLRRWGAEHLPAAQVHVVTVPPRGSAPDLLWQRFASVIGIDPAVAPPLERPRNKSLGHVESELLRRLNERLGYGVDWPVYGPRVTHLLAPALSERSQAVSLRLPAGSDWVAEHSRTIVAELRSLGCSVTGDLDELLGTASLGSDTPPEPGPAELLDAALDALAAVIPAGAVEIAAIRVAPDDVPARDLPVDAPVRVPRHERVRAASWRARLRRPRMQPEALTG